MGSGTWILAVEMKGGVESGEEEKESYSVKNDGETMLNPSSNTRFNETTIDRLSALPDSLILHNLSFLDPDVKEAAVTSVFSNRWQLLWSECQVCFSGITEGRLRKFVTLRLGFIGHFVFVEECIWRNFGSISCMMNTWVRFGVKNKVSGLTLVLLSRTCFYTLPQVLYCYSSLTDLQVERCIVAPQGTIEWKSIYLMIEDVELHEHIIQKILSGCPVLRNLHLAACGGFERLDVKSGLYELKLSDHENENIAPSLEISVPHLRHLYISFSPTGKRLQLTNIPSLVCAHIHFSKFDNSVEVMNDARELT